MPDQWRCEGCGTEQREIDLTQTLDPNVRFGKCRKCGTNRHGQGIPMAFRRASAEAHARNTDPETSHAAARSITSERIRASQQIVLSILKTYGPLTDEDIWSYVLGLGHRGHLSPSGARTRRSELVALGRVRDTGERKTLASGRQAIVWAAV